MTDRDSRYPGRVTLTPVPGMPNTYTLTMADEPLVMGTPPTKANLFPDTTEIAIFGNAANRTVGEALGQLAIRGINKKYFITAGSYSFVVPKDGQYHVVAVGAGGYSVSNNYVQSTSGGGYAEKIVDLKRGDVIPVVVGAQVPHTTTAGTYAGGASSFGGHVTAPGGVGGTGGQPTTGDLNVRGGEGSGKNRAGTPLTSSATASGSSASSLYGPGGDHNDGAVIITWT